MADIEIIAIGSQSVRFQDHESRYNERTRAEKGARPRVSILHVLVATISLYGLVRALCSLYFVSFSHSRVVLDVSPHMRTMPCRSALSKQHYDHATFSLSAFLTTITFIAGKEN